MRPAVPAFAVLSTTALITTALLFAAAPAAAESPPHIAPPSHPDPARHDYDLRARGIGNDTWVIDGEVADFSRANGCNIINTGFIATGAGVLVINTGPSLLYGQQQRRLIEATLRPGERVIQVVNLNQHPDYFFGNQAWREERPQALAGSIAGMQAEGEDYASNLYRLCGDWMKGTVPTPAARPIESGLQTLGSHHLEWLRLAGHTADDLVLVDRSSGVAFVGGLVFADRVPTTPHADFERWLQSLDRLQALYEAGAFKHVVPSHGPMHNGLRGIEQTRDWIGWLTRHMRDNAEAGRDLSEVLALPVPERFARWAAQPAELRRSLMQWYPRFEGRALERR